MSRSRYYESHGYNSPRNLQRDPLNGPLFTWVSNSSIATSLGVRWDLVPFNFWWKFWVFGGCLETIFFCLPQKNLTTTPSPLALSRRSRWGPPLFSKRGESETLGVLLRCDSLQKEFLTISRWWFQIFFMSTPTWGRFPFWLIFFNWVETTN